MKALYKKSDGSFKARVDPTVNENLYTSEFHILEIENAPEKKKAVEVLVGEEIEIQPEDLEDVSSIDSKILEDVRAKRDQLLKDSDFTQVADAPYTTQEKEDWATYRQALRDLPASLNLTNIGSVEDVQFPAKPGEE